MKSSILIQRIQYLVNHQSDIADKQEFTRRVLSFAGYAIVLNDKIANDYDDLIHSMLKNEEYNLKFSEKFINKKIQEIVVKHANELNEEKLRKNVTELLNELDTFNREYNVLVPIKGIVVGRAEVKIGSFTLLLANERFLDDLETRFRNVISTTKHSEEEKLDLLNLWEKQCKPQLNTIFVSHTIIAEPDRAKELALIRTNQVLEVIRLSLRILYSDGIKRNVTIDGEYIRASRILQIFETNNQSFTIPSDLVGWMAPVELSDKNIEKLRKSSIYKVFEIIYKNNNDLSGFERCILKAVHWYSSSTLQIDNENKLLNLITALESVFTVNEKGPISSLIPESVAIILAKKFEIRKSIKKRISKFFKQRNRVTHSGKVNILEQDINALDSFVVSVLTVLAKDMDRYSSAAELWEWIENQRLYGGS